MRRRKEARFLVVAGSLPLAVGLLVAASSSASAQQAGANWSNISADMASTRSTTLDKINPSNFEQLEVAWEWTEDLPAINARGCPIYVDGMLISTAGDQRTVVSIDPATGETLWQWREPLTTRAAYSMRSNHGKGVAYW